MRDFGFLALYYVFRGFFLYVPNFLVFGFLNFLAKCFVKFDKKHTKIMEKNIKMCFENLDENTLKNLIFKTYLNFAFFLREFIINQNSTKEQILEKISFENEQILLAALKQNRPIIVATAHYGNWELFSLAMAAKFGAVSIIGRSLDSMAMNKILSKNRRRFDIELIDKNNAAKAVLKALSSHRLLGILVDQNTAKKDGIECEFFGKQIMHTPAASIFASKTNALIIPAFIMQDEDSTNSKADEMCSTKFKNSRKFKIIFYPQIDINFLAISQGREKAIALATQKQSDALMHQIKRKDDEYFWMHKKFKHFYENIYA